MAARVKDRVMIAVAIARTTEATVAAAAATLLARAASPALPRRHGTSSTTLGPEPSTCTLVRLCGGQQALIGAPGLTMVVPPFTPPLAPISAPPSMYVSQQQQQATSPSWTPWHDSWDQQSLANSFNTMML
jgi:hypothetical protein